MVINLSEIVCRETPAEDGLNVLENRKSTGDNPKSENGDNTSEKSNASVDVVRSPEIEITNNIMLHGIFKIKL